MDDRVNDVLAQRAKLESGVAAAIFLSILFHVALSAIAVFSAWHHSPSQMTSVMNIQFAKPQPAPELTPAAQPAPLAVTEPKPPKIVEKPKKIEKTAPPSPFGKSKKKPAEPPPQQPSNPATQQPVAAEVPIGGAGVTWFRPQVGDNASAIVFFAIDRDGTIRDAKIEDASGNGLYDRAALRAVLEASPLPPLPFGYSGTYLGVHLKFR